MTNIGSLLGDAATLMITGMSVVFIFPNYSSLPRSVDVKTGYQKKYLNRSQHLKKLKNHNQTLLLLVHR